MDIKQEINIKNVNENFPNENQQCSNRNLKCGDGPINLTRFSIPNGSAADIKQEIDIQPNVLLDCTNGDFIQENHLLNVDDESAIGAEDFSKKKNKCKICGLKFENEADLKYHSTNKHPLQCHICLAKLNRKQSLKRHLEGHSDIYRFECQICNRKFKRKENLKEHLISHSYRYDFKCKICNLRLRYKGTLRKHLITHSVTRAFECDTCKTSFKRRDVLVRHLKKKYKCKVCDFSFSCRLGLKYHSVSHKSDPFECLICNAKLKQKQSLKRHVERHLYIYDFECSICDRKFKQEEKYEEHMSMHSTAFECPICRVPFLQKYGLQMHITKMHSNKPFKNRNNKKEKFKLGDELNEHNIVMHSSAHTFECHNCQTVFGQKDCLKTHMKLHLNTQIENRNHKKELVILLHDCLQKLVE